VKKKIKEEEDQLNRQQKKTTFKRKQCSDVSYGRVFLNF